MHPSKNEDLYSLKTIDLVSNLFMASTMFMQIFIFDNCRTKIWPINCFLSCGFDVIYSLIIVAPIVCCCFYLVLVLLSST